MDNVGIIVGCAIIVTAGGLLTIVFVPVIASDILQRLDDIRRSF